MLSVELHPARHTFIKARWITLLMGSLVPAYKGQMGAVLQKGLYWPAMATLQRATKCFQLPQRIPPLFIFSCNCLQNLPALRLTIELDITIYTLYIKTVAVLVVHKKDKHLVTTQAKENNPVRLYNDLCLFFLLLANRFEFYRYN